MALFGFITFRHNELRDIKATILSEVCKDVEVGQSLMKLRGEEQQLDAIAKTQHGVCLDICGITFWVRGQGSCFDFFMSGCSTPTLKDSRDMPLKNATQSTKIRKKSLQSKYYIS